jgi:3-methyladenine DNA glycosylase AlkD
MPPTSKLRGPRSATPRGTAKAVKPAAVKARLPAKKPNVVARPAAARPTARSSARTLVAAKGRAPSEVTGKRRTLEGASAGSLAAEVQEALAWLERHGTQKTRDGMSGYGIVAPKAYGVTMADLKVLGKRIGHHHELALALWETGWYEARMLTALVGDPERLTPAQMERWCRDFDNWAVCDTLCFHLFDRTPHAFEKVAAWARRREEFVKRAGFALLASLALHDKASEDAPFSACLPLVENGASDARNFVKKGVSWALRAIGGRSLALHTSSLALAQRLVASTEPAARWVGKDAQKELEKPGVRERVTTRDAKRAALVGKKRVSKRGKRAG